MASNPNTFAQPPYQAAMLDESGMLTPVWNKWFQQLWLRVGGANSAPVASIATKPTINLIAIFISNVLSTLYTSPVGYKTVLNSVTVANSSLGAQTVSIYIVPAGSLPSSANLAVNNLSIAGGAQQVLGSLSFQVLNAGDTIQAIGSAAGVLQVNSTGWLTQ